MNNTLVDWFCGCKSGSCGGEAVTLHLQAAFASLQAPIGPEDELFAAQLQREGQALIRAKDAVRSSERRLKEVKKESLTNHGAYLFRVTLQRFTDALRLVLEQAVINPGEARRYGAVLPYFNEFESVEQIAAVALVAAVDQLTRRQSLIAFTQHIGAAIEKEHRLIRLQQANPQAQRKLFRSGFTRSQMASKAVMESLRVFVPKWDNKVRTEVGAFLLDLIVQETGLFQVAMRKFGRFSQRVIGPSDEAIAFVTACPPREAKSNAGPMLCPPRPWPGLFGGGSLNNAGCLVHVPVQELNRLDEYVKGFYSGKDLRRIYRAVNHLQSVELRVSSEITEVVRVAWDNGIDGLFPCRKVPPDVPDRLHGDATEDEIRARNRKAAQAHRDRERNRSARIRIERSVQAAEEVAGKSVFQAMHLDYRGRIYAENRNVTTQGQEHEKSLLSFAPAPVGPDGIEWILKAAAGHYGLSRNTWQERLQWGEKNVERMLSAASDPLSKLELWRSAKDPWQFLQLCRGLKEAMETGATGVPIRLDQTTSGLGILSAMLRNREVGRLCNVWGKTPRDLYSLVAENVTKALVADLEAEEEKTRIHAERWLEIGVTRSLIKTPVLAAPYGGTYMGLADSVVEFLDAHYGFVATKDFLFMVAMPSKYLASHIWREMKPYVDPCNGVKHWLRAVVKKCMAKGHPVRWTSPSGLPMEAASRMGNRTQVWTHLYGKRTSMNYVDQPVANQLNPKAATKNISSNAIHSMDAALVAMVANQLAGQDIPLTTNHDCFATSPAHATQMHNTLLSCFAALYRTDWLAVWREEIETATGVRLPEPPEYGDLGLGDIGTNPYMFS